MEPVEIVAGFDAFLAERGLGLEAVVVGGTALGLLGVVSRQTRDCDVLHPELPQVILDASRQFAEFRRGRGEALADDWLNNGPASLTEVLPPGWEQRLQTIYEGRVITLRCLGRVDLLRSKLFALCDRGTDLADCVALAPTLGELDAICPWLEEQDAHPDWPVHVRDILKDLKGRLHHGV